MAIGPAALGGFQAGVNSVGTWLIRPGIPPRVGSGGDGHGPTLLAGTCLQLVISSLAKTFPRDQQPKNQSGCAEVFDCLVVFKLQCFKIFPLDSQLALPVRAKKRVFLLNARTV